ncbi:MAG: CaiB/BaiF CoA transferase family protein [Actinomycetes bacterium]
MTPLPLEGVTVVSLEQAVAAPLATRHLADLGARVVKVERRGSGDFARGYDETVKGLSSAFVWLNRSKESLTLDVKHPDAQGVLARLVARADVVVQNLAPGAARRVGLDAETLRADRDDLVVCDISGYGPDGPYRDRKAYDLLVQGEAGVISVTGTPESTAKVGVSIADIAAGMYAYSGVLAALFARERTGRGRAVEVSLFDALTEWMSHPMYYTEYGGTQPPRMGTSHPLIAPYGSYATQEGRELLVAVQNEREWRRLCAVVLEDEQIADDERFATMSRRVAHREALDEVVGARLRALEASEAVALFEQAQIAFAHVNTVGELAGHPQLVARDRWTQVGSPVGPLDALVPPGVPAAADARMDPVPGLGEHTDSVLGWLGYSATEVEQMRAQELV